MLRLHGARFALAATAVAARRTHAACCTARTPFCSLAAAQTTTACPSAVASLNVARRFFSCSSQPSLASLVSHTRFSHHPTTTAVAYTSASSLAFLRGVRAAACIASSSAVQSSQLRAFRVKGQDSKQQQDAESKEKAKTESENADEESSANGAKKGKGKKGKAASKKKSFMDHINGLCEDYAKFPDIYNSANLINFIVFTVFCLCSTGSNTEEAWWMAQWGLDNSFRPWTWLLHSFLTNNFLSMTYAMMLLHTMCHHVLPTLGSRGLLLYVGSTAVISGAVIWLGNYLYYGSTAAPEKQFGPWDVVGALFVMEYFYYGLTPITILNSFSGWIKYAVWVGEICILYFDWQPTVVGTVVGLALCRGVPRFKAVKPAAAAGAK
jgi:hypothetical protein